MREIFVQVVLSIDCDDDQAVENAVAIIKDNTKHFVEQTCQQTALKAVGCDHVRIVIAARDLTPSLN